MFAYTLFIWTVLYFTGFNLYWQIFSLIASIIILIIKRKQCYTTTFVNEISLNKSSLNKIILFVLLSVLLAISSGYGSLPDNESYYIQTIKWANQEGFAVGLMNLHPFLGQFSAWHILQAGVNLPNPLFTLNDLNAYFFFIFLLFMSKKNTHNVYINWLPFILIPLLIFIDTPSPDLAAVLLSLLIFDLFIKNYSNPDNSEIKQILLLTLFALTIKLTTAINLALLLILWIKHYRKLKSVISFGLLSVLIVSGLWISKNYLLTGYAFYPISINIFEPAVDLTAKLFGVSKETLVMLSGEKNGYINRISFDVTQVFKKMKELFYSKKKYLLKNRINKTIKSELTKRNKSEKKIVFIIYSYSHNEEDNKIFDYIKNHIENEIIKKYGKEE
jgi:hypothetical protein